MDVLILQFSLPPGKEQEVILRQRWDNNTPKGCDSQDRKGYAAVTNNPSITVDEYSKVYFLLIQSLLQDQASGGSRPS